MSTGPTTAQLPATLESSLAKLDQALIKRFLSIPSHLLLEDYSSVAGSDGRGSASADCELLYRYMGATPLLPWGATLPWFLPPSSIVKLPRMDKWEALVTHRTNRVTLRIPQSRIRHFLTDAALFVRLPQSTTIPGEIAKVVGNEIHVPRLSRAVLRLGPDRVIQSLDSEFACLIAQVYKRGLRLEDSSRYNSQEGSVTIACPLFFSESILRALPLFVANSPLPEIEFDITTRLSKSSDEGGKEEENEIEKNTVIQFATEFVSSPGESDMRHVTEGTVNPNIPTPTEDVVQHVPSLVTFRSPQDVDPLKHVVLIPIYGIEKTLTRCLYVRVVRGDDSKSDIRDMIENLDLVGPSPAYSSLIGNDSLPGSFCRSHLKSRFGFSSADEAAKSPYYVMPFTAAPRGQSADYGLVVPDGSSLRVSLYALPDRTDNPIFIEVCSESFTRLTWTLAK